MSLVSGDFCRSLALPVKSASRIYNFIESTSPGYSSQDWTDDSEGLKATLFIDDLAIHSDHYDTLQQFRRVCEHQWLSKKDVILIFLDADDKRHSKDTDNLIRRYTSISENRPRDVYVIFAHSKDSLKNLESLDKAVEQILCKKGDSR